VKSVFFDLDDTLIDHSRAERNAAVRFYDAVSTRVAVDSAEEFASLWNQAQEGHFRRYLAGALTFQEQRRERIREILEEDIESSACDELFSLYLDFYEEEWTVFSDVVPCLDSLEVNVVGVITNGDPAQQSRKLVRTGLDERIADIVCSGAFGHAKPDPRIFQHACERVGVDPSDAIYVGDSLEFDYWGACRAGLRGVLLVRGEKLVPAALVLSIRGLDQLLDLMGERLRGTAR
jgi:putative hydrolase of the HAD superfamily